MTKVSVALAIAAIISTNAMSADFQIKGKRLGMDETSACGSAEVSYSQALLDSMGVKGIDFPATGCTLQLETVAGSKPSEPAHLLFWKGKLVRLVVRFKDLELSEAASLRTAFIELFGSAATLRSPPFRKDSWQSGGQSLELEWTDSIPADVGVYLTDLEGWNSYQQARKIADDAVNALDRKQKAEDLIN